MPHASRHNKALSRRKIDYAIFEIDQESSIQHEKEFIDVIMFMPVIFTLHNRHPHHCIVHLTQCLVIPFVCAGVGKLLHINQFERPVQNVQVRFVWKLFNRCFRGHKLEFYQGAVFSKFNFLLS